MNKRKKLIIIGIIAVCCVALLVCGLLLRAGREAPMPHTPPLVALPNGAEEPLLRLAEELTPADVVDGLLRAVRSWDLASATHWSTPAQGTIFTDAYRNVLTPFIYRIEWNARVQRIIEDYAIVEVSVYAVDLRSALGDLRENAANYLLHRQLENAEPDLLLFLGEHIARLEEPENNMRVMRTAKAHLIKDSRGNWMFDAQIPENAGFHNAVSGGLVEMLETLSQVEAAAE